MPPLGCDFFGSVTYTHIRVRRFAKFFPSHAKVSYAKVSYLRIVRTGRGQKYVVRESTTQGGIFHLLLYVTFDCAGSLGLLKHIAWRAEELLLKHEDDEVQLGLHKRRLAYDFSSYVGRTELRI